VVGDSAAGKPTLGNCAVAGCGLGGWLSGGGWFGGAGVAVGVECSATGDISRGVTSSATAVGPVVSGTPQTPQNPASLGTECPFEHVSTFDTRSFHPDLVRCMLGQFRATLQVSCGDAYERAAPHRVQKAWPGPIAAWQFPQTTD
jgi:hypothetical protein